MLSIESVNGSGSKNKGRPQNEENWSLPPMRKSYDYFYCQPPWRGTTPTVTYYCGVAILRERGNVQPGWIFSKVCLQRASLMVLWF